MMQPDVSDGAVTNLYNQLRGYPCERLYVECVIEIDKMYASVFDEMMRTSTIVESVENGVETHRAVYSFNHKGNHCETQVRFNSEGTPSIFTKIVTNPRSLPVSLTLQKKRQQLVSITKAPTCFVNIHEQKLLNDDEIPDTTHTTNVKIFHTKTWTSGHFQYSLETLYEGKDYETACAQQDKQTPNKHVIVIVPTAEYTASKSPIYMAGSLLLKISACLNHEYTCS